MSQDDAPEIRGNAVGERATFPPAALSCNFDSIPRSEPRAHISAPLWLTSLRKPRVFEIAPAENVSRFDIQVAAQEFWEPAELVLVSSPPGFCVQGSVVYCKKLPSDNYLVGIRLDAPVEHWVEALGFRELSLLLD
jgi:hypothetical protein